MTVNGTFKLEYPCQVPDDWGSEICSPVRGPSVGISPDITR